MIAQVRSRSERGGRTGRAVLNFLALSLFAAAVGAFVRKVTFLVGAASAAVAVNDDKDAAESTSVAVAIGESTVAVHGVMSGDWWVMLTTLEWRLRKPESWHVLFACVRERLKKNSQGYLSLHCCERNTPLLIAAGDVLLNVGKDMLLSAMPCQKIGMQAFCFLYVWLADVQKACVGASI